MYRITDAAVELKVSRTKIYSLIKKLDIKTFKDNTGNYIQDDDFLIIKKFVQKENKRDVQKHVFVRTKDVLERDRNMEYNNLNDREYTDLKEQVDFLKEQLKTKDVQIHVKDVQIQAKDNQINGLIQANMNFSKALMPPETAITVQEDQKQPWYKRFFKKK